MVSTRSWRWAAPVVVAVAIGTGLGVNGTMSAGASPTLPDKSPSALLADVMAAHAPGFSGTIVEHADLGLPDISGLAGGGGGSSDLSSLITGSHTMRVWYAGEQHVRLALLGTLDESDLIRNGTDLWEWSSQDNSATHYTLPARSGGGWSDEVPGGTALTPQQAADRALAAITPTTKVTTAGTVSVAGRAAYQLVVAPRDTGSTVGSVRIAIDSATDEPLRVEVFARGHSKPAIQIGFTQVSFTKPADTQFRFVPPKGVTVKQGKLGDLFGSSGAAGRSGTPDRAGQPGVVGSGWTQVVIIKGVDLSRVHGSGELGAVLGRLPQVSGSWGSGRLFTSSLVNVLFTSDGRLLAGAVPPQRLYAAAATK